MGVSYLYTFIDLFAGLGGFHLALSEMGCRCVFASEILEDLRKQYAHNFPGTRIEGDITKIRPEDIPAHDILCAGFPCQPFSQAGKRQGFKDEKNRGTLFDCIYQIAECHKPRYIILENVSNLAGHDGGRTWHTIRTTLEQLYEVSAEILSPHQFGIPQHRRRIYIVCGLKDASGLDGFRFPEAMDGHRCDVKTIIDVSSPDYIPLKDDTRRQLAIWEDFIQEVVHRGVQLPHFPIWAMEFGANYDFDTAPAYQDVEQLLGRRGTLGREVVGKTLAECLACLPVYARTDKDRVFPRWKQRYIAENRAFYQRNQSWLDPWKERIKDLDNSHQKLEWNCGDKATGTLMDKIVQFRPSGIRVKLPDYVPTLNLVGTQTPIFPWVELPAQDGHPPLRGRYMTLHEAARVQGMERLDFSQLSKSRTFEALGNAVNVTIVKKIMKNILDHGI